MRLFFAAMPEPEVRRQFESASAALQLPLEARRVAAENLHMTIAFAGEVPQPQVAALRAAGAGERYIKFAVTFTSYEYWPDSEAVVATARDCPERLLELHRGLLAGFERLGLARDAITFRAHVTLARKVTQAPVLQAMSPIRWHMQDYHLMHSAGSAAGSVYTVVDTWPLLDKASHRE